MTDSPRIKLELEIPKTTLISQYMQHSATVDSDIKRGVEAAFDEITKDDNLADLVRDHVKEAIVDSIKESCKPWHLKSILAEGINSRVQAKLEEVADVYAGQILRGLDEAMLKIQAPVMR